jgi:hypothetical protein
MTLTPSETETARAVILETFRDTLRDYLASPRGAALVRRVAVEMGAI